MKTYPLYLGRVKDGILNRKKHQELIEGPSERLSLGDVESAGIRRDDPVLEQLSMRCSEWGFAFNERAPGLYGLTDYVYGAGSVYPHDDDGMGPTAGVLVAMAPIARNLHEFDGGGRCAIYTEGNFLELKIGDAFVFNANKEHAWIANCRWVIALHSVRKLRKKKSVACTRKISVESVTEAFFLDLMDATAS